MDNREEKQKYNSDIEYESWRSGIGDMDYDRIDDYYYDGYSAEEAVNAEASRINNINMDAQFHREQEQAEFEQEQQYLNQPEPEYPQDIYPGEQQ